MSTKWLSILWLVLALVLVVTPVEAVPKIQQWTTSNGARVYFVPARQLPMVDIRVVFDAAAARDGERPGLAKLTNALLEDGAGGLDADLIAERLADLGAELETTSARDMASVSLRSLSDSAVLEGAVALLAQVVGRPDFPPEALERVRGQLLIALQREQQSPGDLAERMFYSELYRDHPYAVSPKGNEASVKAIGRADLELFHARYYVARNAVIGIVGDLDRAAAEAIAEIAAGELPAGEPAPRLPKVPQLQAEQYRAMPYPSTQTHILLGQPGMSRLDEDFYALYVANHVLGGGGMVSLLYEQIREQRGLAYSVYSYFVPMRAEGPFILGLQTATENAEEALSLMQAALAQYADEGPTDAQLEAAKNNITGGFPLRIDSNRKILGYLALIGFYGLPPDYLAEFNNRIQAVTREAARAAFARRIHPTRLLHVVVGGDVELGQSDSEQAAVSADLQ